MNTKQKFDRIDQSKLNSIQVERLKTISEKTNNFKIEDKDLLEKIDTALDNIIAKLQENNPEALKPIAKRTYTKKGTTKGSASKSKTTRTKAKSVMGVAKNPTNNIMSVAKEIQKAGESWKDAMERAKQVLKERKEQGAQKVKTEMDKLLALVRTKKELQGFANSNLRRDSVRTAKPRGARVVTKQGSTSNQYGTFDNKLGRKYWESRDRHADRLAPNYPKDMPLLAKGGAIDKYDVDRFKQVMNGKAIARYVVRLTDVFGNKETYVFGIKLKDKFKGCELQPYEVLYGSWTDSGTPFSLSNLQVQKLVPNTYTNIELDEAETTDLVSKIIKNDKAGVEKFLNTSFFFIDSGKGAKKKFEDILKMHFGKSVGYFSSSEFKIPENFANGGMTDLTIQNVAFKNGGNVTNEEKLIKELHRLQRDLNSSRLSRYREGDDSEEQKEKNRERESKLARFNEVLKTLRESDGKMANGGSLPFMTDPNFGDFQNTGSFELGGAFMTTDLAGHSGGGTGGLNADMPLSGVTGTNYTGLVGETGAMSSGELFENGGGIEKKVYGVEKNNQPFDFKLYTYKEAQFKANEYMKEDPSSLYQPRLYNDMRSDLPAIERMNMPKLDKNGKLNDVDNTPFSKGDLANYELGGAMMQNQQVINDASQPYVITESFGNPAQQLGILAKGGAIENQYKGRTPEDVWNNLTQQQRGHFLSDHKNKIIANISIDPQVIEDFEKEGGLSKNLLGLIKRSEKLNYSKLNKYVKQVFEEHIENGEYAKGGSIPNNYEGRTPEDIWNNLSKPQRSHFLYDHVSEIEAYKNIDRLPSREIIKAHNSDWETLDKDIKNRFANHTREGQYASGGSVNKYFDDMTEAEILEKTVVYDNAESLDRYTVFTPDGSVFAMSETASGFNQYVGEDSEIKKGKHLGKRLKSVPKEIEWAVLDRMKEDEEYAYGGKTKKGVDLKEVAIESIAQNSATNKDAVRNFINDNNLSEKEITALTMGVGRQIITKDFVTALVGRKNNPYIKKVVAFTKSGDAYKMAEGGDVLPPSKIYGELLYEAMNKFKISNSEARKKYGQYTINQWNDLLGKKMAEGGFMNNVYAEGGKVKSRKQRNDELDALTEEEYKVWNKIGARSGGQIRGDENLLKNYAEGIEEVMRKKGIAKASFNKDDYDYLTDNNYHLLNEFLIFNGYYDSKVTNDLKGLMIESFNEEVMENGKAKYYPNPAVITVSSFADGGSLGYEVMIDGNYDEPKKFSTFSLAKKWIFKNIKNHDSLELVDSYGDSIFVEGDATKEDLDYLFSNQDASFKKGGAVSVKLEKGVYRVGKPTKVSTNLYEQKIVEIFDNGDISTASDYGRKLGDFKSQKYPIITKEVLDAQYKMAEGGGVRDYMDTPEYKEMVDRMQKITYDVKGRVVRAIGLDRAIEFYDIDYPVRPYQLIEKAVRSGFITLDEINERVIDSALETAQDSEDDEEVGSSDFTAYLHSFLNDAGFKVGFVKNHLTREYANGGDLINHTVEMSYSRPPKKGERTNWAYNEIVTYDVLAKNKSEAKKKALIKFSQMLPNEKPKIISIDDYKDTFPDNFILEEGGGVDDHWELRREGDGFGSILHNGKKVDDYEWDSDAMTFWVSNPMGGQKSIDTPTKLFNHYKAKGYADGGMFDDNDGFMKADNNFNYRYPQGDVHVDTIDESIDLTNNMPSRNNKVVVESLDEDINLNDDKRIRAKLSYEPKDRTPEKMMMVNQRMVIENLPKPTMNSHRNND